MMKNILVVSVVLALIITAFVCAVIHRNYEAATSSLLVLPGGFPPIINVSRWLNRNQSIV